MGSTPTEAPWLAVLSSSKREANASPCVGILPTPKKRALVEESGLGASAARAQQPRRRLPPVVLALSAGPIWLVVDVLHSHVLGSGLRLQGAPDLRALVEPDRAEPNGGREGSSAEEPVGDQDDSGQKERAEFDVDLALFWLGVAQDADTLRQGAGRDRELRNRSSLPRGKWMATQGASKAEEACESEPGERLPQQRDGENDDRNVEPVGTPANRCQPSEVASDSMMRTGNSASVAASTTGSIGV
jgi:hypothetical protein